MAAVEYRTWDFERLIRDVREGRLRVPRFQRGFVWTREQVLGLFESVAQRYPIGTLLVWDTEARFASREKVGPLQVPTDLPQVPLPVGYVLDGHQRLSALVGALGLTEDEASALKGGDRVFLVYVDLDDGRFVNPRRPEEQHLPARLLVQQEPLTAWIDERRDATQPGTADHQRWDDRRARANRLQTTVAHTRVSYINLTGADLNEAVQVFTRLNSTATRASAAELFSALTWAPGAFDFSAEAEAALSTTDAFRSFGHSPVLRILLAALNESIYEVDWAKIKNRYSDQDLQGCMSRVATAWRTATELIGELIGGTNGTVVPYALQLVVLAAFALDCPAPTEGQRQRSSAGSGRARSARPTRAGAASP